MLSLLAECCLCLPNACCADVSLHGSFTGQTERPGSPRGCTPDPHHQPTEAPPSNPTCTGAGYPHEPPRPRPATQQALRAQARCPQAWRAASLGRQTNTGVRSTRLTTHKSHAIRMTELCAAPPRTLQSQRPHFKPRHTCEGIACDIPEKPQHKAPQRASKAPRTTPSKKHPAGRRRLRHAQSRVANEAQGTTQARRHQRRGLITTPRMEAPPRVG